MNIQSALIGQYHAGLAMLRQCVERWPDDLWTSGAHPRNFWRIAYHAIFYTHFYLQQNEEAFTPWEKNRANVELLWETPPVEEPYSKLEMLEYIDLVIAGVDETVDGLDLESPETGFPWYKSMGKLDHELMNVRHLQGHIGQLSELLMAQNVDTDWVGKLKS
jgi:hypothetical protein